MADAEADVIGDADFAELFHARYRDVCRYSALMLGSVRDAEDVAAETFVKAYEASRAGRGPRGEPLPWLLLIARRIVMNRRRRARFISWLPLRNGFDASGEASELEEMEFRVWLRQLSRLLTARECELLFLQYLDDLDDGRAGVVLGLSPSGVRTLRSRALGKLRERKESWR